MIAFLHPVLTSKSALFENSKQKAGFYNFLLTFARQGRINPLAFNGSIRNFQNKYSHEMFPVREIYISFAQKE